MKKIFRNVLATVAIASVASCAEKPFNEIENGLSGSQTGSANLGTMTITASMGNVTKTTYADQSVLWEETDSITVFSEGSEDSPTKFLMNWCSDDKTKASFEGLADLNASSYCAVYPYLAANSYTATGELTVTIPSEQIAVADGFASGANVSVATWQNGDLSSDNDVIFKNVCSLIAFEFATESDAILTESVIIRVKKNTTDYWGISGQVKVCFENEDLTVKEGTEQTLTIKEPSIGFRKGVTYYAPVCAVGEIAGIELIYNHKDGKTVCTKNNDTQDTFTRSCLFDMGTLPVAYDDLLEVTLDFYNGWPFPDSPLVEVNSQVASKGEEYTLTCTFDDGGVTKTEELIFVISAKGAMGGSGYTYDEKNKCLKMGSSFMTSNRYGAISIPYVEDRYICGLIIYATATNGAKHSRNMIQQGGILKAPTVSGPATGTNYMKWNTGTRFVFPIPDKFDIPVGGSKNTTCRDYSIGFRDANTGVRSITYVYSKTMPE